MTAGDLALHEGDRKVTDGRIQRLRVSDRVAPLSTVALAGPTAQLVRVGERVFVAGQTGIGLDGRLQGPGDAARQAEQAISNIATLLTEAGGSLADITKVAIAITDRGHGAAVYDVVGRALEGVFPCVTGRLLRGLGGADLLVQIDVDAVIAPRRADGGAPEHIRRLGRVSWSAQRADWQASRVVGTPGEIFVQGLNGLPFDGDRVSGAGRSDAAAALQAETALANLKVLLAEAGSGVEDICKITVCVADRSFRAAVYPMIGQYLRGVHPVSTGLVIGGFERPEVLFELDVNAVAGRGSAHQRFRKYHSRVAKYGFAGQNLDCDFCMAVRAGGNLFLRGQTGMDFDERLQGDGESGIQAGQAMNNVRVLLGEGGATLADVTRAVLYVTDRAYQAPALAAVMGEFGDVAPAVSVMIVDGLASPELLMEIDIQAMLSE